MQTETQCLFLNNSMSERLIQITNADVLIASISLEYTKIRTPTCGAQKYSLAMHRLKYSV